MKIIIYHILFYGSVFAQFYENFDDISDWNGDVGENYSDGWYNSGDTYSIPSQCLQGDCARYYLGGGGDGNPVEMYRDVSVNPGDILQMYANSDYGTDIEIWLDNSLIYSHFSS